MFLNKIPINNNEIFKETAVRVIFIFLLTIFTIHTSPSELRMAIKTLDGEKVHQLIAQGALSNLNPQELIPIIQDLQSFIKKRTLPVTITFLLTKLIVGSLLFIPGARGTYNAFVKYENEYDVEKDKLFSIWHNQSRYEDIKDSLERSLKPYKRWIKRFWKGSLGGKVRQKIYVTPRMTDVEPHFTSYTPLIAAYGFCLAIGGYLVFSALKEASEIPSHQKATQILEMIKAELAKSPIQNR